MKALSILLVFIVSLYTEQNVLLGLSSFVLNVRNLVKLLFCHGQFKLAIMMIEIGVRDWELR